MPSLNSALPTARDAPDRAKAGFGPSTRDLAICPLEESFGRHVCILEPDVVRPAPDHARDPAPFAPSNWYGLRPIGHACSPFAAARRLAANCASRLASMNAMPRRPAPSTTP